MTDILVASDLTYGSLFTGIAGLDLAVEMFGYRCRWQVEIDLYARGVLEHHWPDVARFDDVRVVGETDLSAVDLICGGFPCQDISNGGGRVGIAGERSGLWREFARIVRELRPWYVFVENVAALRVRGLGRVLGDLAEIGYDAEWDCIRAADVGAPHLRNRLFLLAYAGGQPSQGQQVTVAGSGLSAVVARDGEDRLVADADCEGQSQPEGSVGDERRRAGDSGWWEAEPDVGRVANGVPARMDRLQCLGNAVVPAQAAYAYRTLMSRVVGHNSPRRGCGYRKEANV